MHELLSRLGLARDENLGGFDGEHWLGTGTPLDVITPIDGARIASVRPIRRAEYEHIVARAEAAFRTWREVPAPKRGEVVRRLGDALRAHKKDLGALVTLEMGKITAEGEGEVQEMIDVCDFACGLSRQLHGLTMHSERPRHRMYEQWHPLGVIGVITAFNFPVAVWSWNAAIAAVCGDTTVWKPSPKTPLTAIATTHLAARVCRESGVDPAVFSLAFGSVEDVGEPMLADPRFPLVSATGSTRMGRRAAEVVGRRLGRTLLELGGNNAVIVTSHADLDLATRAILFGAVGTAGQRCTSTRRILVHRSVRDELVKRLVRAYATVRIGDPRAAGTLMGPLVSHDAVAAMQSALARLKEEGGEVLYGGAPLDGPAFPGGHYVEPCIAAAKHEYRIVQEETFAPILYVIDYGGTSRPRDHATLLGEMREAIELHNAVPQGLSGSIFTHHLVEAEAFLAHTGSDCGIANVNIGTSGAEIGGAFGGEKDTGGGRESGSDAWKSYMRRQTNTLNWGMDLPLSQGITFGEP
ncbi:L-piperidine-6-carboxylate dehydrogenase [Polyangium sorediatum]|uniref:aldehyde dehydrogenase (NAD(+)) n=1 Tax=Polyangium sorediatum TaxID=889274 RepID=A0ABT6NRA0_9BACT|nr:aldehyde dehydrogenase family protein [Polyangium sorediatum]MDI1430856.1 aldehyde dehydrogenase family protein [Polyangium sorediatum]